METLSAIDSTPKIPVARLSSVNIAIPLLIASYISHKMDEILRISDEVTIMRDGQYIGTLAQLERNMPEAFRIDRRKVLYLENHFTGRIFTGRI